MKKLIIFPLIIALVATLFGLAQHQAQAQGPADYRPGEVLVKFKSGVSAETVNQVHQRLGGRVEETIPEINVQVVAINRGVGQAVAAYAREGQVEYAEPNFMAQALATPNDPDFSKQWGMHNTGQTGGTADADIDAPEAWDITQGAATVKVAVLDTGIDQDHGDLAAKLTNQADFTGGNDPNDYYGHGTHVAGITAAVTNNATGVAGVGYNVRLMNGKVLNNSGSGAYSWIANGIVWAATSDAKVINMSLGGSSKSRTLENAVNYAWNKGMVVVAAAGNSANPSKTYPAAYSNAIAVAATNHKDQKASFSSYGAKWVDVAAPGENIWSTFPNHPYAIGKSLGYDYGSGTSMATPHVAGVAALVWSTGNWNTAQAVRSRVEQTAQPIPGTGSYWSWGRVNACRAVGGNCPN
jgi:thermitase